MNHAYLGLGSDQGNRAAWLLRGLHGLSAAGVRISAVSSLYLTEPVGDPNLPWFLNCVARVAEAAAPGQLLELCLQVEQRCGRVRRATADPLECDGSSVGREMLQARSLDIDVLLYDQLVIERPGLQIPHPRMHERRFVLEPLVEIEPAAHHPLLGQNVDELLTQLHGNERVWLLAPPPAEITGR